MQYHSTVKLSNHDSTPQHRNTATPQHRNTIALMMLLLLSLANPFLAYSQEEDWGEDEDYSFYEDQYSYVSYENTCRTTSTIIALHTINFESSSKLYLRIDQPEQMLWQNSLIVQKGQQEGLHYVSLAYNETTGYYVGTLDLDESYRILALNTCDEFVVISEVSTAPLPANAMIEVSEKMWKAMKTWSTGSDVDDDLFAFLDNQSEIDKIEQVAFLQKFVLEGTRIPNAHANNLGNVNNTIKALRDTKNDGKEKDCFCRVLRLTLTGVIKPTGNDSQGNPNIESVIMPESTPINTSSLLTSYSGELKGPAKAKTIMGTVHAGKCANTNQGSSWGDSPNISGATDAEAAVINNLKTTVGYANVFISQVCQTTVSERGNCYCPLIISYDYSYDSYVTTSARTKNGICFNAPGKRARAKAEDFAAFMAIRTRKDQNTQEEFIEEFVHADFGVARVATTCDWALNPDAVLDGLKFVLAIVGLVKGVDIKFNKLGSFSGTTTAQIIEQIGNAAYNQYNISSASSALEGLLTTPWVIGNEHGECKTAAGGFAISGKKYTLLNDLETLSFTVLSADYLEVEGLTRWRADAAIRSGYSLSLAVHEQERDEDDCCTRPAGIYSYATFHPTMLPISYKSRIGAHLTQPLGDYFPTTATDNQLIINQDRGIFIPSEEANKKLDCPDTQINGRSQDEPAAKPASAKAPEVALIGNELLLRYAQPDVSYQVQLFAMDGKLIEEQSNILGDATIFPLRLKQIPAGLYAVRLLGNDQSITTTKIFLP